MGKPGKRGRFPKMAKAPKDHVHIAFCLNYCGTAYRGLQIQGHGPTHHTLEGVCVQCMKDIGLIAAVDRGRPGGDQHHFARACRTDRGVHAIRNLLSIFVHKDTFDALGATCGIRDRMNTALPPAIRIAQVSVLAPNFVPRNCCNRRAYRYMVPAYALLAPCDSWEALVGQYPAFHDDVAELLQKTPNVRKIGVTPFLDILDEPLPSRDGGADDAAPDAPLWLTALRTSITKANKTLADHFVGPHRFHNFSVDAVEFRGQSKVIKPDTDEAARSIYRCDVARRLFFLPAGHQGGVTVDEYQANVRVASEAAGEAHPPPPVSSPTEDSSAVPAYLPFVAFQIEGNSFLFNMIRKVVGTTIAVCRGASEGMVTAALSPEHRVCTPLAPGPYLYLALSSYHGYDATIRSLQPKTALRTLQDDWSGAVAHEVEHFAFHAIAKDIVDIDLNRVPPLDEMLLARDRARDVLRPQWREEDAHLASMKEYKPLEPGTAHKAPLSEMTVFLRRLRVYNWKIKHVPLPENSKVMLEMKNKRARLEQSQAAESAAKEAANGQADEKSSPAAAPGDSAPTAGRRVEAEVTVDAGEDGWIYVAPTEEEEAALRRAQFLVRWKRARPWEFNEDELEEEGDVVGDNDE